MSAAFVVTGGTGGLGRAVVRHLLDRGDRVAVPYRDEKAWQALRAAAPQDRLWGRRTDVADLEEARRFVAYWAEEGASWIVLHRHQPRRDEGRDQ